MPLARPIIALLTDFGLSDWYVASMKAVIARLAPAAQTIDITHQIKPGDLASAAFALSQCYDDFPRGTIFVCIVDPGVGTQRRPIILFTGDYTFVAPDNGVLSLLNPPLRRAYAIESGRLEPGLKRSFTFHGRDVFAPAAAMLARGANPLDLGTPTDSTAQLGLEFSPLRQLPQTGRFIYFDHYGNAISNLQASPLSPQPERLELSTGESVPFRRTFAEAPLHHPVAYLGSGGLIELAINQGSAREGLGLETGTAFSLA